MSLYVFTGPTLDAETARRELSAVYLPPAAQGDVYRAALERPTAIGIIDGYFERIPSVSHKEVLWAMSHGVHVFGASSMGALRAAELAPFGMEGVGAVFEAFQRGELEDDDEVAVAHAAAEDGFRPLSEAMVNIRATLRAAEDAGVIGPEVGAEAEGIAKGLFYADRCYPILLARLGHAGLDAHRIGALRDFLREGRVNQKRDDALALLRTMRRRFAEPPEPKWVRYHFERTDGWEYIRRNAGRRVLEAGAGGELDLPGPLREELALAGGLAPALRGALVRALAIEAAERENRLVRGAALQDAADGFRRDRGLHQPTDFQRWVEEQQIGDVERFLQTESSVRWAEAVFGEGAERHLADHLRSTGEYGALLARARDKARVLAGNPPDAAAGDDVTSTEPLRWYFEHRLRRAVPADLPGYACEAGFSSEDALRTAILRELRYVRTSGEPSMSP
jgi:hypothetical protein